MKSVWFAMVLPCLLLGVARTAEPVYFAEPRLKTAVEEQLWTEDPTPLDMLELTYLYAGDVNIVDLTGLEYAVNLQTLQLSCNWITDISVVAAMSDLEALIVNNNEITDLSPLSGLSRLQHFDIHDNHVLSNISPLSGLVNLETLILRGNAISDISPLSGLTELRKIHLERNQVSDISPLAGLTRIEYLDLRFNPLSRQAFTVHVPQIAANNPGIDIRHSGGPFTLSLSSTAGGSVVQPGEGEFTYKSIDYVRLEAKADPCFVFVGWTGGYATGGNPVFIMLGEDQRMRAHFLSVRDILHVDNHESGDPGPPDLMRSDPVEDGTIERPFDQIQEAIEVAAEGSTIRVHPGTYRENIDFLGKNIRLMGIDPGSSRMIPYPVIRGTRTGPVVRFGEGEGPDCMLAGFVITRGRGRPAAAIHCEDASPTLTHCLIVGNRSTDPEGAAVYCLNSQATLTNCTIADNYGGERGAALVLIDSNVTVRNSILWENRPAEILASGTSVPSIHYCDVRIWWLDRGNFSSDPLFAQPGLWAGPNDPNVVLGPENNQAVWMAGDYHLKSQAGRWHPPTHAWRQDEVTSPCIDSGDPADSVAEEPVPNGGIINLGAYGGTAQAGKSPPGP